MRNMMVDLQGRINWMMMNIYHSLWKSSITDPRQIYPIMDKYSDKGDSMYNLYEYMTQTWLKKARHVLKCQGFHITLDGYNKRWYNKLPLGSIQSCSHLKQVFFGAFIGSRMRQAPTTRLNDIWQEEAESLKSYLAYFSVKLIAWKMILNAKAWDALWKWLLTERLSFDWDFHGKNKPSAIN